MENFLIVGCTSGIGKALTLLLLKNNKKVLGLGRNKTVLKELQQSFPAHFRPLKFDIRDDEQAAKALSEAVRAFGNIDVAVVLASITQENANLDWRLEKKVIETNVLGWAAICVWLANYFEKQNGGHLVGVTSLAKYLASVNPAYSASKAFEAKFLDGLRVRLEKKGIWVTEIMPGFVDTPMIAHREQKFWVISAEKAAKGILKAIQKRKRRAVVSGRWKVTRLFAPHLGPAVLNRFLK